MGDGARMLQQLISFITSHICSFCAGKKNPYSAADQQYRRSPYHHWLANLQSAHDTPGWAVENLHSSTYFLVAKGESGILRMHMSFACLDEREARAISGELWFSYGIDDKPNPLPCIKARLYVQNPKLRRPRGWEVARFYAIASVYLLKFKISLTTANEAPFTVNLDRNLVGNTGMPWCNAGYMWLDPLIFQLIQLIAFTYLSILYDAYQGIYPLLNGCSKNGIH